MSKMPKALSKTNHLLLPTLFDRLLDYDPQRKTESMKEYVMDAREIRAIVQRDLGFLFNAMNQDKLIDFEQFKYVADSTLNYGISAMAGTYQTKVHWPSVCLHIKEIIEKFEPRLSDVNVIRAEDELDASRTYNILNFQITGQINIQPYPLEFIVQSSIDLESTRMFVKSMSLR